MLGVFLAILAGLLAGVINTLAGSGSLITLSLLSFLGLPADIANGTNRVGLLSQSAASTFGFVKNKQLHLNQRIPLLLTVVIGAGVGVWFASVLDKETFQFLVGGVFLFMFFVLLLKGKVKLIRSIPTFLVFPVMFVIGLYAGFIQAGAGVFMLAVLTVWTGEGITAWNPFKVFLILMINLVAFAGYAYLGKVNWSWGIALAVGQFAGGLIGVRLNNLGPKIEPYLKKLLLVLVLVSVLKFWGLI